MTDQTTLIDPHLRALARSQALAVMFSSLGRFENNPQELQQALDRGIKKNGEAGPDLIDVVMAQAGPVRTLAYQSLPLRDLPAEFERLTNRLLGLLLLNLSAEVADQRWMGARVFVPLAQTA